MKVTLTKSKKSVRFRLQATHDSEEVDLKDVILATQQPTAIIEKLASLGYKSEKPPVRSGSKVTVSLKREEAEKKVTPP